VIFKFRALTDLIIQFVKLFTLPFATENENVIIPKITVKCNALGNNTSLKDT
jgi:hypothetical protein